jgi:hypothetical protein
MPRGTIRDHVTGQRWWLVRFFPDFVIGAIAGG